MTSPLDRTTAMDVGIVDVVVLAPAPTSGRRPSASPWRVLTLRRAEGTRCTGAWELVHGRIEAGERPPEAALREVLEETGLTAQRLYSVATNPFYMHRLDTVHLAIVFAVVVDGNAAITLGPEHDAAVWRTPAAALRCLAWPREHDAVRHALHLLRTGDAGPVEDVLRIL